MTDTTTTTTTSSGTAPAPSTTTPARPTDARPNWAARPTSGAINASDAQAISFAEKCVANGQDPAEVERLLKAGGYEHISFTEDTRTEGQIALDRMGAGMPTSPADYRLNVEHRGHEGIVEAFAEHKEMTEAFYQAALPPKMAQSIYDAMKLSERQVSSRSGADLQAWKAEQKAMLGRIRSLGSIQDATIAASIAIGRFPEATRERLLKSGALDSAEVVTYLAMAGRAIVARENV